MLPIATVQGVRDGISTGMIIDLSEYLKKTEGVSKEEMQSLESVVANKLDIEPQHKHHLEDIKQLQSSLDSKYDKGEKYSYNVILSDSEKIPYLENPKITLMELVQNKEMSGYKFYVDESNGDLMIILNEILIGHYSKSGNKWVFNGITETLQNSMNNYATKDHVHDEYVTKAMLDEQTLIENVNIKTKINELETVVQNQQNNFASVNHTHDDKYCSKNEVNNIIKDNLNTDALSINNFNSRFGFDNFNMLKYTSDMSVEDILWEVSFNLVEY